MAKLFEGSNLVIILDEAEFLDVFFVLFKSFFLKKELKKQRNQIYKRVIKYIIE